MIKTLYVVVYLYYYLAVLINHFFISFNLLESFEFNKDAFVAVDKVVLALVDVEFEEDEPVALFIFLTLTI
jgi:hypothetical protein